MNIVGPADFDRALVTRKRRLRRGEFVFVICHGRVFVQLSDRVDTDSWAVKTVADTAEGATEAPNVMAAGYLTGGYDYEEIALDQVPPLTAEMLDPKASDSHLSMVERSLEQ